MLFIGLRLFQVNLSIMATHIIRDRIMILDIETDGKKHPNGPHIVQISYLICDSNFKILKSKNLFVNDKRLDKSKLVHVDFYEKITVETIKTKGKHPMDIFLELDSDFEQCFLVYGHNINMFDKPQIINFFNVHGLEFAYFPPTFDTMLEYKHHKHLIGCKDKLGRPKNPSLSELYAYVCETLGKKRDSNFNTAQHDGLYDCQVLHECIVGIKVIDGFLGS
jgi:hypothetical protein